MRIPRTLVAAAGLALVATGIATAPADAAAPAPKSRALAKNLISPLTAAVDDNGTAYVTENFAGALVRVRHGKKPKTVYASKNGNEVGGVSVFHGRVMFTETASDAHGNPKKSWVKWITHSGKVRTLANIRAYENRHNPDHRVRYGVRGIGPSCAAQWPTRQAGPAKYRGLKDSHPYATLQTDQGVTFVADAGMNAVLRISPRGKVRTLAVTRPVRVRITKQLAGGMGLPDCVVGRTYYGESVPTDVALGRHGRLFVTTEGGGLGEQMPLGSVYSMNLKGHRVHKVTGGLFGPVGIAVARNNDLFVSQLFGGKISRIKHGTHRARTFAKVNMPAAVEWTGRGLYATVNVLSDPPAGKLVRFRR